MSYDAATRERCYMALLLERRARYEMRARV